MKLKYEFAVREIMGEHVMIPMGQGALEFSGMITTSEVGAFLVEKLKTDVTRQQLLDQLMAEYDVEEATAAADLDEFLENLEKLELLEK